MECHLHRIGFYKPKVKAVNCMAFEPNDNRLALSRDDASIEVWDLTYSPYLLWHIPGVTLGSVEDLCWIGKRLLSTGLSGALVEWDLKSLSIKQSVLLTGHAAWCIDAFCSGDKVLIAVGTEQGYINIFSSDLPTGDIIYLRLFDKQEGRVLCCKFNKTGELLVTGSSDCIRIWSVSSGQAINKMVPSRRNKNAEMIIWNLAVLSDMTIITGDSCGRLTFWDGNIGEQYESFTTHRADILTVCVSKDEKTVYAAGVDPLIVSISSVYLKTRHWVRGVQRNIHRHDVRSLIIDGQKLISAGVDGHIAISSFPPRQLLRWPPLLPKPCATVCADSRLILLKYSNYMEVWRIGVSSPNEVSSVNRSFISKQKNAESENMFSEVEQDSGTNASVNISVYNRKLLKLQSKPSKLLSLHPKNKDQIICCCASSDGKYIAYSTDTILKIYQFSFNKSEEAPTLTQVSPFNTTFTVCHNMTFSCNNSTLISATANGILSVIDIDESGTGEIIQTIDTVEYLKDSTIQLLGVSSAQHIIAADSSGSVGIWIKKKSSYEKYAVLPRYKCTASALSATPDGKAIIVAYVDNKLIEYNLSRCRISWSVSLTRVTPIIGLTCDPNNNNIVLAYDHYSVWAINKNVLQQNKSKVPNQVDKNNVDFTVTKFKYIALLAWLRDMEAVLVEVSPDNLTTDLPPAFEVKRFGAQ